MIRSFCDRQRIGRWSQTEGDESQKKLSCLPRIPSLLEEKMTQDKLIRGISRWDLLAIAINTVIGAGIFGLPSKVAALIGNYGLIALVLCAGIVALIVICFAEVSSRFDSTGGMYLYARESFGPLIGFEVGWLYWIVRVTTGAANCNLLISYLGFFYPPLNQGVIRMAMIAIVFLVIGGVNFLGIKQTTMLTNIFTAGKIIPMLIFVSVGIFFIQPANFTLPASVEGGKFGEALLILVYAFSGFEATTILAGESREPRRNLPWALLVSLGIVAALYILIQIVSVGNLPELAKSERPLADAAVNFLGYWGASFITVGAVISILGNLNIGFLAASRIPFAMAEQKELPAAFAKTHDRFKTPSLSIALTAIVLLILTIQSSFLSALTIATITRLIVYATTCAALPVLRNRPNAPEAQFSAPGGVAISIISLGLIIWLLTNVDYTKEGLGVLIAIAVGFALYFAGKQFGKRPAADASPF
jgi:amino acid transporter